MTEIEYRNRIMACMAVATLLLILLIRFWPVREITIREIDPVVIRDPVLIDDVQITRHRSSPPPPLRPMVPQPVPDDFPIEEPVEFDRWYNLSELPPLDQEGMGSDPLGDEGMIVGNPQLPPSVVKIVEPSVPELPDELRGRIEMVVNFLVDREGGVEEASIVEIRVYSDRTRTDYEVLPFIQYGLMGATLEAALNWRFRAARHEGSVVRTYTLASFHY